MKNLNRWASALFGAVALVMLTGFSPEDQQPANDLAAYLQHNFLDANAPRLLPTPVQHALFRRFDKDLAIILAVIAPEKPDDDEDPSVLLSQLKYQTPEQIAQLRPLLLKIQDLANRQQKKYADKIQKTRQATVNLDQPEPLKSVFANVIEKEIVAPTELLLKIFKGANDFAEAGFVYSDFVRDNMQFIRLKDGAYESDKPGLIKKIQNLDDAFRQKAEIVNDLIK